MPFNLLYITDETQRFRFKSGHGMQVAKLTKQTGHANSVTIRISAQNNFMLLLKHRITRIHSGFKRKN